MVFIGNKSNQLPTLLNKSLRGGTVKFSYFAVFCLCFFSSIAESQPQAVPSNPILERQAQEISETVMSPFCPGLTLSSCTSGQAQELRSEIRTRVLSGEDPESLKSELVAKYGDTITGQPKPGSIGQTAPVFFILLGIIVLVFGIRALAKKSPLPERQVLTSSGSLKAVEEELQKRLKS